MPKLSYVEIELDEASPELVRQLLDGLHLTEDDESGSTVQAAGLFDRIGQARKLFDFYNKFKSYLPLLSEFSDLLDFSGNLDADAIAAKLARVIELADKLADLTEMTTDDWFVGLLKKVQDAGLLDVLASLIADRITSSTPGMFSTEKAQFAAAGIDPGSIVKLIETLAGFFSMAKAVWPLVEDLLARLISRSIP